MKKSKASRMLALVSALVLIVSVMAMPAGAYDDSNTYYRNLNEGYHYSGTKSSMKFNMKYGVNKIWSYTDAQLGMGPATGKAYTSMIPRGWFGSDKAQIQADSYEKKSDGYVKVTCYGSDTNANTVMHSAYSNVTSGWRIDYRYKHQ